MLMLMGIVALLVAALVGLLTWTPQNRWGYVPTTLCGGLAVVIALALCWLPL